MPAFVFGVQYRNRKNTALPKRPLVLHKISMLGGGTIQCLGCFSTKIKDKKIILIFRRFKNKIRKFSN